MQHLRSDQNWAVIFAIVLPFCSVHLSAPLSFIRHDSFCFFATSERISVPADCPTLSSHPCDAERTHPSEVPTDLIRTGPQAASRSGFLYAIVPVLSSRPHRPSPPASYSRVFSHHASSQARPCRVPIYTLYIAFCFSFDRFYISSTHHQTASRCRNLPNGAVGGRILRRERPQRAASRSANLLPRACGGRLCHHSVPRVHIEQAFTSAWRVMLWSGRTSAAGTRRSTFRFCR